MRTRQLKVEPPSTVGLTTEQLVEWDYVYNERLGMMVGDGAYTPEQDAIARKEASEAVTRMKAPQQ